MRLLLARNRAFRQVAGMLAAATLLGSIAANPETVRAATTTPSITAPTNVGALQLLSQTTWVTPGIPFTMELAVKPGLDPTQVDLVTTVLGALPNRSQFQQSLEDKAGGSTLILERRSLLEASVAPDRARVILPVSDAAERRYYLRDGGVYPVRVELRESGSGTVIDRFTTHLINVPTPVPPTNRLSAAFVIPVAEELHGDRYDPEKVADKGASAAVVGTALTAAPDIAVNLLPSPSAIDKLSSSVQPDVKDNFAKLVAGTHGRDSIRSTWSPLPAGMYSPEVTPELEQQFAQGSAAVAPLETNIRGDVWVSSAAMDTTQLSNLMGRGVQRLVVRESDLANVQRSTTLARPFNISLGKNKGTILAMQADAGLSTHFVDPSGGVLGAQRLLADLATIWNDLPGQERSVVVLPPPDWKPDSAFLSALIDGLRTSPLVAATDLDTAFAAPPEGGSGKNTLVRQLAAPPKADSASGLPLNRMNDIRKRLNGFAGMVDSNNAALVNLRRLFMFAQSTEVASKDRNGALDRTEAALGQELKGINMPIERSIRLTARQGEIPVSLQNDGGYPVQLVVRLTSDKLTFPQGSTRTLSIERQHVTEAFAVEARTSGAFPVEVRIESPDGSLVLANSRVTVRSTAASGVGVFLSVAAGLVLIIWWIRSVRKEEPETA